MTIYTVSMKDAKSQDCSATLPMAQITAANHDAQLTAKGVFKTALLLVSDAAEYSEQVTHSITKNAAYARPTSGYANREAKVVLTITDTNGDLHSLEIPAPDMDKWPFNTDGKEIYDAPFSGLNLDVQGFIDAIDANWNKDGLTGTVTRFRFVGRNL